MTTSGIIKKTINIIRNMKKAFTLCLSILFMSLIPATAFGDDTIDNTFQFFKASNTAGGTFERVGNGSVFTAANVNATPWGTEVKSGLYVSNTSSTDAGCNVHMMIDDLPSGDIQFCMLDACRFYNVPKVDNVLGGTLKAGNMNDMLLEWCPNEYGTATITLWVAPVKDGKETAAGPRITVKFVYADPTAINHIGSGAAAPAAVYNINGIRTSRPSAGLNIVRYSDGTVKKVVK